MKGRFCGLVWRWLCWGMLCLLLASPLVALAQFRDSAPIVVDGRRIFNVSQSGEYSAKQRAEEANRLLRETLRELPLSPAVRVDYSQEIPVIRLNGNAHLLSVTAEDAPQGRTVQEQAEIWVQTLQTALAQAERERQPDYLIQALVLSLVYAGLAIAASWGLGWLWHRWLKPRWESEPVSGEEPVTVGLQTAAQQPIQAETGARVLLTLGRAGVWLSVLVSILELFPQTRQWSRFFVDIVVNSLFSDLFSLGDSAYSVLDLILLLALLAALIVAARSLKKGLQSRILRLTGLSRAAQETIAIIANYTFILIGAIVLLQLWGLDISSLTVFAGVLGVGIGLGIQGIAKEFVSGLVLMFERPIQVGDFVEVGGLMGTVERISVRSTEIRTLDHISVILPNSRFLEAEVINWSHNTSVSRLRIPVGVAYGSNPNTVRSVLLAAAREQKDVLSAPSPRVFFLGFGENALNFDLLVWIGEPRKQFQIKSDLYFAIEALLRQHELHVPFPQRDLHLRSGSLEVSPQLVAALAELAASFARWSRSQPTNPKPEPN
ncbi:MAG: mechanosensitive ion channel [Chloroflexaceae bacterium]|nr:mechanosensitive ion channel [Chloroflexaceae bacterium]